MDNFSGSYQCPYNRVDCKYNETYDTIFELGKIGGREGHYKKGKGLSLCCLSPDYRRFVNIYEFHILKSFHNTKEYVITCVCTY